jgi:diguanylate cyclase (GGDEF)-like protein/PAS domain S-box-containing protein
MTYATDTDIDDDDERTRRLSRDRMFDPINLILVPNLVVLVLARQHHVIASAPLWAICGSLVVAHATSTVFAARFTPGTPRAKPTVFLALTIGLGGAFLYVIGWGAVLAVSYIASAVVVIQADGARYKLAAIVAALVTILAGEIAVTLGFVRSMISEPTGHGLAVIEAALTAFVISLVARGQRDKELAEARERESEERFRALVQYASDAIVVIDDTGAVMYASPAAGHLFGCDPAELERFDLTWVDPDHAEAISEVFARLRTRPGGVEAADVPIRRADGTSRWVEVRLTNLLGNPAVGGHVCNMRDIGERRVAHQQLLHDAQHDAVTHLPNRRLFVERLDDVLRRASPDDLVAVLFVDVDHFKDVNDQLGHETGDRVLVAVANRLSLVVRPNDLVARYGGDEFTVLLHGLGAPDGASEIAERITAELSQAWCVDGHELMLSVSVGVSVSNGKKETAADILRRADQAMYQAKRNGRSRWELFDAAHADIC